MSRSARKPTWWTRRKVSTQISLSMLRRLTRTDTFRLLWIFYPPETKWVSPEWVHRTHHLGRYNINKSRTKVAKSVYYPEREEVRSKANSLQHPYGIRQQFPRKIMEVRKRLVPIMPEARKQKREAYITIDKLLINGQLYKEPTNGSIVYNACGSVLKGP